VAAHPDFLPARLALGHYYRDRGDAIKDPGGKYTEAIVHKSLVLRLQAQRVERDRPVSRLCRPRLIGWPSRPRSCDPQGR
jgi:hypothetical protein